MGEALKRMAELLKEGATMLPDNCPDCNVPLFKLREEVFCPKCERRVVLVKRDEDIPTATAPILLAGLEQTILGKIRDLDERLRTEKEIEGLQQIGTLLSTWLDVLAKIRRAKREGSSKT